MNTLRTIIVCVLTATFLAGCCCCGQKHCCTRPACTTCTTAVTHADCQNP